MRKLVNIVDEINALLAVNLSYSADFYNISEKQSKSDQGGNEKTFIVAREQNKQAKLPIPQPGNNVVIYHRIIDETTNTTTGGKGNKVYQISNTVVRLVGYGPAARKDQNNIDSQEFLQEVLEIINQYPSLSNKETIVSTDNQSSVSETVREEELGTLLPKELKFEMIGFYLEYRIRRRINCEPSVLPATQAIVLTQAQYDAITPNPTTYYLIDG